MKRKLTFGEVKMLSRVFDDSINYLAVRVNDGSLIPATEYSMTPGNTVYMANGSYRDDYSESTLEHRYLFVHEMAHVWQHQRGDHVVLGAMLSRRYYYDFDKPHLSDYGIEQQASIIADYWMLKSFGVISWASFKRYIGPFSFSDTHKIESLYKERFKYYFPK